jgi:hypothetical protein
VLNRCRNTVLWQSEREWLIAVGETSVSDTLFEKMAFKSLWRIWINNVGKMISSWKPCVGKSKKAWKLWKMKRHKFSTQNIGYKEEYYALNCLNFWCVDWLFSIDFMMYILLTCLNVYCGWIYLTFAKIYSLLFFPNDSYKNIFSSTFYSTVWNSFKLLVESGFSTLYPVWPNFLLITRNPARVMSNDFWYWNRKDHVFSAWFSCYSLNSVQLETHAMWNMHVGAPGNSTMRSWPESSYLRYQDCSLRSHFGARSSSTNCFSLPLSLPSLTHCRAEDGFSCFVLLVLMN